MTNVVPLFGGRWDPRCWNCHRLPADHNEGRTECVTAPYPGATSWPNYEPRGLRKWV